MRMKNKIGIITAAGSGSGRAGAVMFAREGAAVTVVDRDRAAVESVAAQIREAGGTAWPICADLRGDDEARSIVTETVSQFGGLDFVWNHLGHPGPAATEDLDMADWDLAVDLNLRSQLLTTSVAIPLMKARGRGSILFTASVSGLMASGFSPVYSAVKFGVVGLSRSLARRYAKDGIRVNAICPGPIDTPMLRVFVNRPGQAGSNAADVEDLVAKFSASTAMGRAARPEEIAAAALFLLSDDASYITGIAMPVDGGYVA